MRNTPRSRAGKSQASTQSQGKLQVFSLKPTHKGRPPGPARFRCATGRLIQGSTATPRHKARYIGAAPCHGPNLVFERSPEPPEVSLRLRDRGGTRQTAAMAQSYRRNILLRRINGQLKPVGWPAQASANCKTAPSGDEIAPMAPFELPKHDFRSMIEYDPDTYISRLSLARPTPPGVKFGAHTHRPRTASPASLGRC